MFYAVFSSIIWLSEIYLTSLIALFWNFPLFWNFLLLVSHSKNIRMSNFNFNNYYLLIINCYYHNNNYKYHNSYCSVGVMELCLLNLFILIDCFLSNSYPCVLLESLSHVINQESHVYSWNFGKIYLVHFLKFWNLKISRFSKSQKISKSQDFKISKKWTR